MPRLFSLATSIIVKPAPDILHCFSIKWLPSNSTFDQLYNFLQVAIVDAGVKLRCNGMVIYLNSVPHYFCFFFRYFVSMAILQYLVIVLGSFWVSFFYLMIEWSVFVFLYIHYWDGQICSLRIVLKHWKDPSLTRNFNFLLLLGSLSTLGRNNFSYFARRCSYVRIAYVGILSTKGIIFGCKSFLLLLFQSYFVLSYTTFCPSIWCC